MKNCPYCSSTLNDNAAQCHICGYVLQQYYQQPQGRPQYQQQNYQQNYQQGSVQGNYNGAQPYNPQQNMYAQQYQQPQYYSYMQQNHPAAYNYQPDAFTPKSSKKKDKKERPLWIKILIAAAVIIGIIWMLSDGFKGAENADNWLNGSSKEAQMAEIETELIEILDSTKVESFLAPTIGQMVVRVFSNFDITVEPSKDEETVYYLKISGDYTPSPSSPYFTMNGSITYRIDIEKRTCKVWSDPNNIHAIFIAYIVG